jgi:hypothetical protein
MIAFSLFNGCQSPDELLPSVSRNGINSIVAAFENGAGEFVGLSTEGSNEIVIPIPYFFPESSNNEVTQAMLSKMRVRANLDDNVIVEPSLFFMDLTKSNTITVTDQRKEKKQYTVRAEVRKSNACLIEEFSLPELGLTGVINQQERTISIVSLDNLPPTRANVRLSHHATISPNPVTTEIDYNNEVTFVVTAHDGVTTNTYRVNKSIPNKIDMGIREGSFKIMFEKRLANDLGITTINMTGGIAVTKDYVVLNTRGEGSVYINARTGVKVGTIDLGAITGGLTNFYNTADRDGNILINNLAPNAGTFKIWKLTSVTGTPELFIDWDTSGSTAIGRKVSINGSIDGNAIITAGLHSATNQFARWTVVNGVLTSHTPEIVTISGYSWSNNNVDIVCTSDTDVTADYFVIGYSDNRLARVRGTTNTVVAALNQNDPNYIGNAVDYVEFNKGKYVTYNHVNSFTWGAADQVWVINADGNFSGSASSVALWTSPANRYGANAIMAPVNGNGTGDVAFRVSDDGYFLYFYFMFTNGYVVGVQFDCIDM